MNSALAITSSLNTHNIHAVRAAALHFLLSAAVALLASLLVFGIWFPTPLRELVGGTELFWLVVGVDVVCGPLLTLVVFNATKPRAELRNDLILVALIQLLALGYGIHTMSHARPVALVHEVDRFRVVSFADLDQVEAPSAPDWAQPWSFSFPRTVGLRTVISSVEKMASIAASLQGIEPSQRPSWWQDYALSVSTVLQRAKPIADLTAKHPTQRALIDEAIARTGQPESSLRWLPLVSHRALDWTALIDAKTAQPVGYAHLDGF